jgi:hypothetical protein
VYCNATRIITDLPPYRNPASNFCKNTSFSASVKQVSSCLPPDFAGLPGTETHEK